MNKIRPNRLDMVTEHVISGINLKIRYKIVLELYAKNFVSKMSSFLKKMIFKTDRLEL